MGPIVSLLGRKSKVNLTMCPLPMIIDHYMPKTHHAKYHSVKRFSNSNQNVSTYQYRAYRGSSRVRALSK